MTNNTDEHEQRATELFEENKKLKELLAEKDDLLQQQEADYLLKYEELHRLKIQLIQIHSSEGWKLLSFYYRAKAKVLPAGSRRYTFVKKLFNKIRGKKG